MYFKDYKKPGKYKNLLIRKQEHLIDPEILKPVMSTNPP